MSATTEATRNVAVAENAIGSFTVTPASYKELLVERRGRVLLVQINRPTKRNALSRLGYYELMRAINEAKQDSNITLLVLTGVGEYFCAGADLAQTRQISDVNAFYKSANTVLRQLVKTIIYCPKMLVALVNGPCLGVGVTLTGLFDVVYCTDSAYFETPFTRIGLCPELCSSYIFPLLMGRSKATELLLFGERMSAQTAVQYNFVANVFQHEELPTVFWPKMTAYSELPSESLRISKQLLRKYEHEALVQAMFSECAQLSQLRFGPVYQQTVQAFIKKGNHSNTSKL